MTAACHFYQCALCELWREDYEGSSQGIEQIKQRMENIKRMHRLPP